MKTGLRIMVAGISGIAGAVAAQNSTAPAAAPNQPADVFERLRTLASENAKVAPFTVYPYRDLDGLGAAFGSDQARIAADQLAQLTGNTLYGNPFGGLSRGGQYERGQMALELRRWEAAIREFGQVAASTGPRADGALYWKAYALNKLGRRDEALAALAELRNAHPGSRWLDDGKALEIEVRQAAGKSVSPEAESDDDLKIQALNGLAHADPERTVPALDNVLKSAQSPKVKERALFVLAQSDSPKARQRLEQIARGGGNPDLQVKAISYLAARRQPGTNLGQTLAEIYGSTSDAIVKRAALNALAASGESERVLQIIKSETGDLKLQALNTYLSFRRSEDRRAIFGGRKPHGTEDVAALYAGQGPEGKRAIVSWLAAEGDAKSVISLARNERDRDMARYIVGRLADMKSPEAADYLMDLLKK